MFLWFWWQIVSFPWDFVAYQALKLVALWTHLWHTLPNALKSARKQPTSQTANPATVDQDLVKTQNTGPPLRGLLGGNLLASSWVRNIQKKLWNRIKFCVQLSTQFWVFMTFYCISSFGARSSLSCSTPWARKTDLEPEEMCWTNDHGRRNKTKYFATVITKSSANC